ncbi:hypothetical protein [Marinospirillum minutulum]|uniref:hypothetical protein n=1 Tax=Marinospirillum minutulum TaxID=64974 RepID=UPI00048A3808|nr:hypothetical protein [Marinospirillum minutulum]
MRILLFIFFVISLPVNAKTFDISRFNNANQLIWDDDFKLHINEYFGITQKKYFWSNATISEQVKAGFGGAPENVKAVGDKVYLVSACRAHSCDEKSAYITSGDLELFAVISYLCENDSRDITYCPDGQLVIFYKDILAKDSLSSYLIDWKDSHVPKAKVIYEKII